MAHILEFLDDSHDVLLRLAPGSVASLSRGKPVALDEKRRAEFGRILQGLLSVETALAPAGPEQQSGGTEFYTLNVAPGLQQQFSSGQTDLVEALQGFLVQSRNAEDGRIAGVGVLRDLFNQHKGLLLTELPAPQAIAAMVAISLAFDVLNSMNVMHDKLDRIEAGVNALRERFEAEDNSKLTTAFRMVERVFEELNDVRTTAEDRRAIQARLEGTWTDMDALFNQEQDRLRTLVQPKQAAGGQGRRFPLQGQLPVVQFPVRRRAGEVEDETIAFFTRLVGVIIVKLQVLAMMELTDMGRGMDHKELSVLRDFEAIRDLHQGFRRLWATDLDSIQKYQVNVAAQFDLAEQIEKLSRELEAFSQRSRKSQKFVLEVERGQVKRVASLSA